MQCAAWAELGHPRGRHHSDYACLIPSGQRLTSTLASGAHTGQSARVSGESVQEWLEAAWVRIDADARASKNSPRAVSDLIQLFGTIGPGDRLDADDVLIQWATSSDTARQFDALALIDHFKVVAALPAVRDPLDDSRRLTVRPRRTTGPR